MGSRRRRGRRKEKQETGEMRGRTGVKHISTLAHYLAGREAGGLWGEMNCKSSCLCLFFPQRVCVCNRDGGASERQRERKRESERAGGSRRERDKDMKRKKKKDGQTDSMDHKWKRRAGRGKKTAAGLQGDAVIGNTSRMRKVKTQK